MCVRACVRACVCACVPYSKKILQKAVQFDIYMFRVMFVEMQCVVLPGSGT